MSDQLYIMIMGDRGKMVRLPCSRRKLLAYSISGAAFLLFLIICTSFSLSLFSKNRDIEQQLADLSYRVKHSDEIIAEYQRAADQEKMQLSLELEKLKLAKANQQAAHKEEKEMLLSTAVSELNMRSELIEQVMESIGIDIPENKQSSNSNKGGPYIPAEPDIQDELLAKADNYLDKIRYVPLGNPVTGHITSRYGKRMDPLNKKKSIHEGVDIKGKRGEKIYATADGLVKRAFKNGGYGNYIEIDHQNGYFTAYAHMQSYTVSKGDKVRRGQLVGLVGNTGRSTGPHLHYEIRYKKTPVNPVKYMQVVKLLEKM